MSRTNAEKIERACAQMNVHATAVDDVKLLASRDNLQFAKTKDAREWLAGMRNDKAHLFAGDPLPRKNSGGTPNPWSPEAWNITEQGRVVKALGLQKAASLAASAGSHIGAIKPARKFA